MSNKTISKDAVVIERTFEAPVGLIWQMWTKPEHFKKWYGPNGFTVPVAEMDVRTGGKHLFCMQSPDGSMKMWSTGVYKEVVPNKRLVYTDSPSDENGNIIPALEGYPGTTEVTIQFEELGGRTQMTMTHAGVPADSKANEGWEQAFVKMAALIESSLQDQ